MDGHYSWIKLKERIGGEFEIAYAHNNRDWRINIGRGGGFKQKDMFAWTYCQGGCNCGGRKREAGVEEAEEKREIGGASE